MTYKLTPEGSIIKDGITVIPAVADNADYQEYLAWLALDNTPDPADPADPWPAIRARRDAALAESDWTQVSDTPLSPAQLGLWRAYRQALRDLPQQYPNPAGVVWPEPPTATRLQQAKLAEDRPAFIDDSITMEV